MPRAPSTRTLHQNEEEGRHLETIEGSMNTQKTLDNTRRNQKTGLSYGRPTRDYTKCIKWTETMHKEIYLLYVR